MTDFQAKTLVARLTAVAPAAVAVLIVQGDQSEASILRFWKPNQAGFPFILDRIRFGEWRSKEGAPSESVVICKTSEDRFEIHCHGGKAAANRILEDLVSFGIVPVATTDKPFPRMLTTGYLDGVSYEASIDLASATTLRTVSVLLDQQRGALRRSIESILDHLGHQRVAAALSELAELESRIDLGAHLLSPWRIAIVGAPNVGKSSLINRWLGYDRAIVHASPGTTRDLLCDATSFEGWPVELVDTAGIRGTEDAIERAGIEATKQEFRNADLVLELIAPDVPRIAINVGQKRKLLVCTKSDMNREWDLSPSERENALVISSLLGDGVATLAKSIVKELIPTPIPSGSAVPFRPWQAASIRQAIDAVNQGDETNAMELLQGFIKA